MEDSHAVGPPPDELRPIPPTHGDFPVYRDLAQELAGSDLSLVPDQMLPHVLSVAAAYSYASDVATLASVMTRMGLLGCRCYAVSESVDAMLINAHARLVQSRDGRVVILAFRGTPPMDTVSWLVDVDTTSHNIVLRGLQELGGPVTEYQVHAGFYRNTRAVRYMVLEALLRARRAESVIPDDGPVDHAMEALYVTGHSLGGAMACLFTLMLRADPAYGALAAALQATCTFGQPMVGTPALAETVAADDLADRFARYIYRRDPVPHLPPAITGGFAHFGIEYRFGNAWQRARGVTRQSTNPLDLLHLPGTALARRTVLRRFPLPWFSADDHNPANYVTALTPKDRSNEFGDDHFSR
jgi:hypothetical protein